MGLEDFHHANAHGNVGTRGPLGNGHAVDDDVLDYVWRDEAVLNFELGG